MTAITNRVAGCFVDKLQPMWSIDGELMVGANTFVIHTLQVRPDRVWHERDTAGGILASGAAADSWFTLFSSPGHGLVYKQKVNEALHSSQTIAYSDSTKLGRMYFRIENNAQFARSFEVLIMYVLAIGETVHHEAKIIQRKRHIFTVGEMIEN